jgi:hypothetical protein
MVDTIFPYQVVFLTHHYSISGGLFLHEQRLSDYLNDRRDTSIFLRNASVARLEEPSKILETTNSSFIPKAGIIIAFEPPQKTSPLSMRFIKYPKQKYPVFLGLDGMQVHGELNQPGPLDLRQALTDMSESFLPITQATVTMDANPGFIIKRETILVSVQHIRFLGDLEPQTHPEDKPKN